MRLLLVEDDEILAQTLGEALQEQNYVIDIVGDGESGWDYVQVFTYDLILLDVSLPKLDGISLCQRLRSDEFVGPILLLTARDDSSDKVAGLDAGADDYVVKPCTVPELLARVRALLRRRSESGAPELVWGDLRLDPSSCEVTYCDRQVRLSPKEYALLELFLRNPKRVFSKSAILEHLWSFDDPPNEDTIRAHIKGVRRKFKAARVPDAIATVYGLGYRLKPLLEAQAVTSEPAEAEQHSSTDKAAATRAAVAKLWQNFKQPIFARLADIDVAVTALQAGSCSAECRHQAERQAHKLAGSLGMFGLSAGSDLARQVEQLAIALSDAPSPEQIAEFYQQAAALRSLLEQACAASEAAATPVAPAEPAWRLLAIHCTTDFGERLQVAAQPRHVAIALATDTAQVQRELQNTPPDIVLLDCTQSERPEASLAQLQAIATQQPQLPVLVAAPADSQLEVRVAVARLGGKGFLPLPLLPEQVLDAAADTLRRQQQGTVTVMAVDDDPVLLAALTNYLQPWGVQVHRLGEPQRFWEVLEQVQPDALILDIEMPGVSGIELCQVVRQSLAWQKLPILFLSGRRDREIVQQLYQAGADDYIAKPVTEAELVARLFNRLERTRLLRELADTDPLSGVANRQRSEQDLARYLNLAQRDRQPLCLAALDLDRFKAINQQHGHASGDRVLRRFGQLLRQHFRSEDIVARWGGEDFAIGMYGLTAAGGRERLIELQQALRAEQFLVGTAMPLQVSFSAGLAEYPQAGKTVAELYRAADAALSQAKTAGGDRLVLA
ncbi:MAG: response regulator [Spirulinaceae cyanobacterium SM2_1_0]|nr:response regulator [Spirulinaceae cyanobacterium SM2_1_0]